LILLACLHKAVAAGDDEGDPPSAVSDDGGQPVLRCSVRDRQPIEPVSGNPNRMSCRFINKIMVVIETRA
jgi:hypothetical protein